MEGVEEGALCRGPMSRSGDVCDDGFFLAVGAGMSVKRSSPGIEEEEAEEGRSEDSREMRLLLLGCLELEEERGGWGEGDLRPVEGRGTDTTCREYINYYTCTQIVY